MQTLKSLIVVSFLLGVLWLAFITLNAPQPGLPEDLVGQLENLQPVDIEMGEFPPLDPPPGIASSSAPEKDRGFVSSLTDSATNAPTKGNSTGPSMNMPPPMDFGKAPSPSKSAVKSLPKPSPLESRVDPDPTANYPGTTAADARLPDPASLALDELPSFDSPSTEMSISDQGAPVIGQKESVSDSLENAFAIADRQVAEGRLKEALFTLSLFHGSPNLTPVQERQLLDRLDPLAGDVIYSAGHFLESPHKFVQGEDLMQLAEKHNIPWQLLANINQIANPKVIVPGTELKMVKGPFRAVVSLSRSEITVFLDDLYAGRFPITVGNDPAPQEGVYAVLEKKSGTDPATSASQGEVWLNLGKRMCIHSVSSSQIDSQSGCIRLSAIDARDLASILSQGSLVTIR